jgi:DNA-binding NtrC family response regulator
MLPKAIAIIDDETDLINLFSHALRMNGYNVCVFTDPIDALNKLRNSLDEYALVISDFRMPMMNGYELCTKLLSINPKLEVIIMSAYQDIESDTSKFIFLNKPILIAQLLKIVKEKLTK